MIYTESWYRESSDRQFQEILEKLERDPLNEELLTQLYILSERMGLDPEDTFFHHLGAFYDLWTHLPDTYQERQMLRQDPYYRNLFLTQAEKVLALLKESNVEAPVLNTIYQFLQESNYKEAFSEDLMGKLYTEIDKILDIPSDIYWKLHNRENTKLPRKTLP